MSNARNLARLIVDGNGDVDTASLDNVQGLPDAIDVNASAPADSLAIDASGRVGIGTSSPKSKLDVKAGSLWVSATSNDSAVIISNSGSLGVIQTSYDSTGSYTPLLFKTSEIERMRIDTAGRVTMPYQPAFYAYRGSGTAGQGSASDATGFFNTTVFNTGNHYNTTNGRFTAPVTGVYAAYFFSHSSVQTPCYIFLFKNGTMITRGWNDIHGDTQGWALVQMSAGDYIYTSVNGGYYNSNSVEHNSFCAYLLG